MNKRNLILLAVLLILIIGLTISRSCENVEKVIKVFSFKTDEIVKIEIIQQENKIILLQENDSWFITEPINAPVKESQINRFYDTYLALNISSIPVSESFSRQNFYNVDSTGVIVELYAKNNKILSKVIHGKSQNNPNVNYLRKEGSNSIYQTDNISSIITTNLNSWREDKLLLFDEVMLQKITIAKNEHSFSFAKSDEYWTCEIDNEFYPISSENQDWTRNLNALLNLRTTTFFDHEFEKYEENLENAPLQILFQLFSGELITLKIAQIDDNFYVAQKNDELETLYRLTNSQFNQLNIDPQIFKSIPHPVDDEGII